ncbi:unnamed protein product [Leptosia nina]|uniref:TRAF3-interacting protein 1 n=1 Tax=Leptosia nina TaxID=320188 RepID=A0AAV1JQY8_9NEOP
MFIGKTLGKELNVKSSKIVAGQEPEKTNELLQCLAEALDKNLSSEQAIKTLKVGTNNGKKVSKEAKVSDKKVFSKTKQIDKLNLSNTTHLTSKIKSKDNENQRKKSTLKGTSHQNKNKSEEKIANTPQYFIESAEKKTEIEITRETIITTEDENATEIVNDLPQEPQDETIRNNDLANTLNKSNITKEENDTVKNYDESKKNYNIDEKATASHSSTILEKDDIHTNKEIIFLEEVTEQKSEGSKNFGTEENGDHSVKDYKDSNGKRMPEISSLKPSSARPLSSRPGAPKIRDKHDNTINVLASSDHVVIGKVNIITESSLPEEDEESSFQIEITDNIDAQHEQHHHLNKPHGHLVQQILDSQKSFGQVKGRTEIEWELGSQATRDDINKDLEQLQFNIQALSRVSNPLGKLLDHVQEDVEVMRQESQQWLQIYGDKTKELSKQREITEEAMMPLYSKIKQFETDILEKRQRINDLKIIIHKNNLRIEKLLSNGHVHVQ